MKLIGYDVDAEKVDLGTSSSYSLSAMSDGSCALSEMVRGDSIIVATFQPDAGAWVAVDGAEYADLYIEPVS